MSDPPPRKVGSLRDRIAAFENKGPAPTPAPPPPRPKPGHVTWQPKPASPTSPRLPVKTDNDDGGERKPGAGMSAADAQQSIGKLSLKERMAALQGSAAFGGPAGGAGAPPPRPAGEKPKWKPPPVVQRVEPIGGEDEDDAPKPAVSPPATVPQDESVEPARSPADDGEPKEEKGEEGEGAPKEEGEPDPEEEERQRRAALAARMARLGGARVGMGPPIFGKKPDVPPKRLSKSEEKPKEEEVPKEEKPAEVPPPVETGTVLEGPTVEEAAAIALPPSAAESRTESSTDYFPNRKGSGSAPSSLLSPEESAAPTPVRSPYMPVPQAPKRAAPPRKRPAKSPSPVTPVLNEEFQESPSPLANQGETAFVDQPEERGDRQPEVTEGQIEDVVKEVVPQAHEPVMVAEIEEPVVASEPEPISEAHEQQPITEPSVAVVAEELAVEEHTPELELVAEEPQPEATSPAEPLPQTEDIREAESETPHEEEPSPVPAPEEPAEEPEEDEAARRKRIAERLAKSGGFNPFAGGMPPPVRRESSDSARSPPPPPRRDSLQEATSPKPSLPERKASVGSVESAGARKSSLDVGAFTSEEPHIPDPSAPAARELHEEPIEEGYEDEEAEPRAAGHGGFDDHEESLIDEPDSEKYEDTYEHEVAHTHEIAEEPENVEEVSEPAPPPPPPRATRPPPAVPQAQPPEVEEELKSPPRRDFPPPPPRRVSVPPPPPPPAAEEFEERQSGHDDEAEVYAQHAREIGLEHGTEEHEDEYDERQEGEHEYHVEEEELVPPPPPPPRHAAVPPPPPPPAETYEEDEEEEPTPPPPRVPSRSNSLNVPPLLAPRPPPILQENESDEPEEVEEDEGDEDEDDFPPPPPPRSARPVSQLAAPPPISATGKPVLPPLQRGPSFEQEMLDDTDGDPIDPRFYSPTRSPSSSQHVTSPQSMTFPLASPPLPPARMVSPPPVSPPPPPPQRILSPPPAQERTVPPPAAPSSPPPPPPITSPRPVVPSSEPQEEKGEDEEDSEQARRRTIAERMAKLGGIRFGAPPPVPSARRAPVPEPEPVHEEAEDKPAEVEETPQEEQEEDEFARKQRIAARIAGMGGMRFGMMPGAAPPKPPPRVQHDDEEEESVKSPPPPKRSAPVPPPPPPPPAVEEDHGSESDYQHVSDSDRIEHEESELEEVTHEDAEEEAPPVPDRHGRRVSSGPPPVPQGRPLSFASAPPVPRTRPPAPPAFTYPPPPHAPHPPPITTETHGDFVVVDQPQSDEPPPPPPPRGARPPGRAPPRAPPAAPEAESQWETPSIPNIDFGGETDLSLSAQWSEDSTNYPPAPPPVPPSVSHTETEHPLPPAPSHPPPSEHNFTADELQAQWGRVGVQVHEIAATLFEKSKKSLVGDGSYRGFVAAVIGQVPNAAQPTAGALDSFGYLVYSQAGGAVQRRVSDIMPGDVIVVSEAKFKGHKGLQSYSQTVGVGEPLVGIIGDFELKKSKVKVYQANQHVGQQSVETVSYRLEDLKSGAVKIYRVLES